ncbi:putative glyoxalase superfamily protein PhnB [Paenibacillus castaneae]|uniref:glyoxalase superfamily protein n=1 Tax=Paenibacillus castaneae TaxID=474957 RepID=UPI000C9A609B|nr:glyoxalase superfamily protein [Paenibacillus castaneae]NIK76786.1 putative glyoxalase superfamily protein PhnB [Paenibacillus castaneae]
MGYIQCQIPIIPVLNMNDSIAFYRDVLGFKVAWIWNDNGYAAIQCGEIEFHLDVRESFSTYRAHSYLFVQNADEIYTSYQNKSVEIVHEIEHKPWGVKEFTFRDINGHMFRVAEKV